MSEKIAYLVAEFPKPSETFVSREVLTLQKLGMEIVPFAFQGPGAQEVAALDAPTRRLAEEVEYLPNAKVLTGALASLPAVGRCWCANRRLPAGAHGGSKQVRLLRAARLARELEARGIEHLHAHWPYATQVAYLVHKLTGMPFSVSIHAHEVEHDHAHFPATFEALSFATFCNRAAMERLLQRLPTGARERSHLIYHGVDLSRFAPLPFPASATPLRVISAGRLTKTKGFDRLVRACACTHAHGHAIELTILGQGAIEPELRALAEERGFSEHLHLPGWLPHDQVAARLAESHLFALMADTNFHDGLPNVVLEAMASARPVILSPIPAASEAITDGAEGFVLSAADDEAGMCAALDLCQAAPEKLAAMGGAARDRVAQLFDQDFHARRLQTLFTTPAACAVHTSRHES